eukprot:COSAG04_NODE_4097_length_2304_cov_1.985488_2_plen_142_part_01
MLVLPQSLIKRCGQHGCGYFQVAHDPTNATFPLVAWLQPNTAPPPPTPLHPPADSAPETDPVVRLDPATGRAVFLRDITVMPSGQLAPKGQGLGAFDPATQTLYFPGSAGDLVDNRVFSVNLRTSGSPTVNTGAPKLDVNGM